ncbi:MAG: flavodoxin domain-containing protein [Clostridia bacterium]|nr:flavodoxin domain-containing protein [Clostridia bacterium]
MKALVLYYSRTGTTEKLARRISKQFNADLVKMNQQNDQYVLKTVDLSDYDLVFVGFPMMFRGMPDYVMHYLSSCDFRGVTVVPFATFAIAGLDWVDRVLSEVCHGANVELSYNHGVLKRDDWYKWLYEVNRRYYTD